MKTKENIMNQKNSQIYNVELTDSYEIGSFSNNQYP